MKFKVGDKVRRVKGSYDGMSVGDVGTIKYINGTNGGLSLKEFGKNGHERTYFELVTSKDTNIKIETKETYTLTIKDKVISDLSRDDLFELGVEINMTIGD